MRSHDKKKHTGLTQDALRHPVLERLNDMAQQFVGMRYLVVFPTERGWGQVTPGGDASASRFCKLIQQRPDGIKRCRMCHVLMSIAAGTDNLTLQTCHAGASVMTVPLPSAHGDSPAVLSSCVFLEEHPGEAWKTVRRLAKKLGIDPATLKEAFHELPRIDAHQAELATSIMNTAVETLKDIKAQRAAAAARPTRADPQAELEESIETEIQVALSAASVTQKAPLNKPRKSSGLLVDIIADLVRRKPNMPFSVNVIASAARMTPNHFSNLFHEQKGQCFSDFLAARRIALAQELLKDLTLNISDVALRVGYEDPGYFTRRYKQHTGMSPRRWRCRLACGDGTKSEPKV